MSRSLVSLCLIIIAGLWVLPVFAQEETPEVTAEPTLDAIPAPPTTAPPEVTDEPEPEITPEVTVEVEVTAEVTPEVTPEVEETEEVTPEVTVEVITATPTTAPPTSTPGPVIGSASPQTVTGNTFVTETRAYSDALMNQLILPPGFRINVFANNLGNARMIAVSDTGMIYVSRPAQSDIIMLTDANMDGQPDAPEFTVVASGIPFVHGLAIRDNQLYIAGEKAIYVAEMMDDGSLSTLQTVTENLPDGDQHTRRTLAFGPDGTLYVALGSSCNACIETNQENATIITVPLDGSGRTIFASGLRNSMGFDWHPQTSELWAMDHGTDWRGDDSPPEELNRIQSGSHYGWPFCYGIRQVDEYLPYDLQAIRGFSNEEFCGSTVPPVLTYQAHSAPIDLMFYDGTQFPAEYTTDAFVTMRGSWNRFPATGYKVVRVHFENGQPVSFSDFVSGFLIENGTANFARPAGLAVAPDGSLLFTDDTNGIVYRVSYAG